MVDVENGHENDGRTRARDAGKSCAADTSSSSERTISRVRIIYARNYVAAGACKLIGKMVVKVNLVGSQDSGSRWAQVARAHEEAESAERKARTRTWGETPRNRTCDLFCEAGPFSSERVDLSFLRCQFNVLAIFAWIISLN